MEQAITIRQKAKAARRLVITARKLKVIEGTNETTEKWIKFNRLVDVKPTVAA
jgi:hypothetical protein